jgi:hypothetical protein
MPHSGVRRRLSHRAVLLGCLLLPAGCATRTDPVDRWLAREEIQQSGPVRGSTITTYLVTGGMTLDQATRAIESVGGKLDDVPTCKPHMWLTRDHCGCVLFSEFVMPDGSRICVETVGHRESPDQEFPVLIVCRVFSMSS